MKKLMLALLMTVALASVGNAVTTIGLYADDAATICSADLVEYTPTTVYFIAELGELASITTAEFRLENHPGNPGYPTGQFTPTWTSELTIGDLDHDFSIAWQVPQPGPFVLIGTAEVLAFDPAYIGADHECVIGPGLNCECLVVVDENFDTFDAEGGHFVFNCTGTGPACECVVPTATEDASWGAVKALY